MTSGSKLMKILYSLSKLENMFLALFTRRFCIGFCSAYTLNFANACTQTHPSGLKSEQLRLEGSSEGHLVPCPYSGKATRSRLPRTTSGQLLKTAKEEDHTTSSQERCSSNSMPLLYRGAENYTQHSRYRLTNADES